MLSAQHLLCSHIVEEFVLCFSLKILSKSSHLYSSDTNYKAVQQALTLLNTASAACHGRLGASRFPMLLQVPRGLQLRTEKARVMWTMQRGHLAVQTKTAYKQSFGK